VPLVVFNTLGWPRTDVGEGDVGFALNGIQDFDLLDAAGHTVPTQLLAADRFEDGGLRRVAFAFLARGVPSLGYQVYHVIPRQSAGVSTVSVAETNGPSALENEFCRATSDVGSGALLSLRLKPANWEALSGPANVVALEPDMG